MVGVPRAPYQLLWGASFASGLSEDGFRPLWEFHLTMLARTWSPSRFPSAWPRGATADREGSSGGDTRTTRVSADPPQATQQVASPRVLHRPAPSRHRVPMGVPCVQAREGDTGFAAAPAPGTVSHGAFSARDLPVVLSCESHSAHQGPGHLGGTSGGTDEIQEQSPQPLTPTHPFLSLGTCLFCSLAAVESHASGLCVRRLTEHRVSEVRPRRSQRPRPPPPPFRGRATLPFVDGTLCPSCAFGLLRILPLGASEAGFGVDARFPLPWVDTDTW